MGRYLCLHCPRDQHLPPFLPFRFQTHIRRHLRRFPTHLVTWWCWDHCALEESVMLRDGGELEIVDGDPILVALEADRPIDPEVINLAIRYRQAQIESIQAEIETLRRLRRRAYALERDPQ